MRQNHTYTGSNTNEISFPLGGIGTGSVGLAGNGRLVDWEIFNRPNKGGINGFSFFAVKAEKDGEVVYAKVLHGDLAPPYSGTGETPFVGYGHGVQRETLSGYPHFESVIFQGKYPVAELDFRETEERQATAPIEARLTAFSPFIPLNNDDSSLPTAIFSYEITNRTDESLDVTVASSIANPAEKGAVNAYVEGDGFRAVRLGTSAYDEDDRAYGSLSISTDAPQTSYQCYWFRGMWFDNITVFWKEFSEPGPLKSRNYDAEKRQQEHVVHDHKDTATLAGHMTIPPGQSRIFRFVLTWHYPNYENYWNPEPGAEKPSSWKNHYATRFGDALDSAAHVWKRIGVLTDGTLAFRDALFGSTLPEQVLDAVSANLSILKSPTVLRLTDGTLYGFEGNHVKEGSCEGSCTHVWNYEQVTPHLFPGLARSMREAEYKFNFFDSGKMAFRMMLPPGRDKLDFHAAADGQFGSIVRVYREWKISGDDGWLRAWWPKIKHSLEYAWSPDNTDGWDADKDGVLEGVQHHTLDIELYGPSSWLNGYYHAALLACSRMADAVGDPDGAEYRRLYEQGRKWVDEHLFNGEYFHQKIDLADVRFPVDPELGQIKYQVAEGCHIDQVIGQWFAHLTGLGYIFDPDKVRSSLSSIYNYNFVGPLREYANACRIFALNDEKGVMICTYPRGNSPHIPILYAGECMNGFEYQAACHMIYEGLVDEGLEIVKAIRDRYDGERRNPWNELECGSNYTRSMASYGLLLAMSGFEYDMCEGVLGFNPLRGLASEEDGEFRTFWAIGTGWGQVTFGREDIRLKLIGGELSLSAFRCQNITAGARTTALLDESPVSCGAPDNGTILFADKLVLNAGQTLRIMV